MWNIFFRAAHTGNIKSKIPNVLGRHADYDWFQNIQKNKLTLRCVSNKISNTNLTNPISGKSTQIHESMLKELHENYFGIFK